jgi:hypothetical protein
VTAVTSKKGSSNDSWNLEELYSRIDNIQKQQTLVAQVEGNVDASSTLELPVVCMDALLPRQRLPGRTTDETFERFLQNLSVGGVFVMVSLEPKPRKLRRCGVLCKIEVMDAPSLVRQDDIVPTAVDYVLTGLVPCRLLGPPTDMQARVGRWRRGYDPDGEKSALGWGMERFVDDNSAPNDIDLPSGDLSALPSTEWTPCHVVCDHNQSDTFEGKVSELAERILSLLKEWEHVASNEATYENTDVVATIRRRPGHSGLRVYPDALLRNVRAELGDIPSHPADLALYGAALINPIPAMGVAPEIRGRVLSAATCFEKLSILEWGIQRSLANLRGARPL